MKPHDEICKLCPNRIRSIEITHGVIVAVPCKTQCILLTWLDGNYARKEKLLNHPVDNVKHTDYNKILAEIIEIKRDHDNNIDMIQDKKKRAIVLLLENDYTLREVSQLFRCSVRSLQRIKDS